MSLLERIGFRLCQITDRIFFAGCPKCKHGLIGDYCSRCFEEQEAKCHECRLAEHQIDLLRVKKLWNGDTRDWCLWCLTDELLGSRANAIREYLEDSAEKARMN